MSEIESLLSQLSERESHFVLNPAIGKQQIDFLKSEIGQDIPPQLLEMLSCFDGEKLSFSGMIGGEKLLSSQEIIDSFKTHIHIYGDNEDDDGFMSQCPYILHGVRWRTGWIPIAAGEEEAVYLDTCPPELGVYGQIIMVDIPGDLCGVIATDIVDLLRRSLACPVDEVLVEWPYINPRTGTEVEKTSYFEPKRPLR